MSLELLYATSHITGDILCPGNVLGAIDGVLVDSKSTR
jgi:hypothetical protein